MKSREKTNPDAIYARTPLGNAFLRFADKLKKTDVRDGTAVEKLWKARNRFVKRWGRDPFILLWEFAGAKKELDGYRKHLKTVATNLGGRADGL